MSVLHHDVLGDTLQQNIVFTQSATFGANGSPLEVLGQVTIPVILGDFTCSHLFIVVKKLSVPGILGADFLVEHKAKIDCTQGTLWLGDQQAVIPIEIYNTPRSI